MIVSRVLLLIGSFLLVGQFLAAQEVDDNLHPGRFFTIEKHYEKSYVDGYNLYIPNSYTEDSDAFPLIVFFQGGLGVGGPVDAIFNWELPKELKETRVLDSELNILKMNTFVYLMPHISYGQFYQSADAIKKVIQEVQKNYNIDENRTYLTGLSRGGHGAWGIASRMPELFAAVVPICGAGHGIENVGNLANLPIWTAHNVADETVGYNQTVEIVNRIQRISNKKFFRNHSIAETPYQDFDLIFTSGQGSHLGHDAWTEVYNNVNFYKWLLQFSKNP